MKEKAEASPKVAVKRPAEASPTQGSTQKKHKKNKGGDNKPAAAAATGGVKPEAKAAAPTANVANSKPAGSQSGEGKKHKKNKVSLSLRSCAPCNNPSNPDLLFLLCHRTRTSKR